MHFQHIEYQAKRLKKDFTAFKNKIKCNAIYTSFEKIIGSLKNFAQIKTQNFILTDIQFKLENI